jgi:hypothetical protein
MASRRMSCLVENEMSSSPMPESKQNRYQAIGDKQALVAESATTDS